jgi:hypothetical protein
MFIYTGRYRKVRTKFRHEFYVQKKVLGIKERKKIILLEGFQASFSRHLIRAV